MLSFIWDRRFIIVSVSIVILLCLTILFYNSQSADSSDWSDVFSKGFLLILSASWFLIIQRLLFDKYIHVLLSLGFLLFFVGVYIDFWEELKELADIFGHIDDITTMIGMAFASIGFSMWVNVRIKTENDLINSKKKLEEEIIKRQKKDMLLKEVYHRVKNNFSVVSSIINLKSNLVEDKQAQELLRDTRFRIQSMAIIHQQLYDSEDLENINFKQYLNSLTDTVYQSYVTDPCKIVLEIDIEEVALDVDVAIPCGLIINELLTNSIKYAFPPSFKDTGKITVSLTSTNKNEIELKVIDNGVGMPGDFEVDETKSLGLTLVKTLTKQINGILSINGENGTKTNIKFKI